jgi:hypothetical protein
VGTARASAAQDDKDLKPICCRRWIPIVLQVRNNKKRIGRRADAAVETLETKSPLMQDARQDWRNRRASYPSS